LYISEDRVVKKDGGAEKYFQRLEASGLAVESILLLSPIWKFSPFAMLVGTHWRAQRPIWRR